MSDAQSVDRRVVTVTKPLSTCPICLYPHCKPHQYLRKSIIDLGRRGKAAYIDFHYTRFACPFCRKHFVDEDESKRVVLRKRMRYSRNVVKRVLDLYESGRFSLGQIRNKLKSESLVSVPESTIHDWCSWMRESLRESISN